MSSTDLNADSDTVSSKGNKQSADNDTTNTVDNTTVAPGGTAQNVNSAGTTQAALSSSSPSQTTTALPTNTNLNLSPNSTITGVDPTNPTNPATGSTYQTTVDPNTGLTKAVIPTTTTTTTGATAAVAPGAWDDNMVATQRPDLAQAFKDHPNEFGDASNLQEFVKNWQNWVNTSNDPNAAGERNNGYGTGGANANIGINTTGTPATEATTTTTPAALTNSQVMQMNNQQRMTNPNLPPGAQVTTQDINANAPGTAINTNGTIAVPTTNANAGQANVGPTTAGQGQAGTAQAGFATTTLAQASTVDHTETASSAPVDKLAAQGAAKYSAALVDPNATQMGVSDQQTVAGQMANLLNFDPNKPTPLWATGAVAKANQLMAARGMDASSMAGQAITQALISAALPIAQTDAATYQQTALANQQARVQTLLSNQSAINASQQFNASSDNQVNQFVAQLATQINQFNASQINNMSQFNATQTQQASIFNAAESNKQSALNAQLSTQASTTNATLATTTSNQNAGLTTTANVSSMQSATQQALQNAQLTTQVSSFNAQQANARDQFNASQNLTIQQSNAAWNRSVNTANTAAANQATQLNALNTLGISNTAYQNLQQQARDEATWAFTSAENAKDRGLKLAQTTLATNGQLAVAGLQAQNGMYAQIGAFAGNVLNNAGSIANTVGGWLNGGDTSSPSSQVKLDGTLQGISDGTVF